MEQRIVVHHVGSRGVGFESIPITPAFAPEIVNVRYDADVDCVAQTQNWWDANSECETVVHPYCLLDRDGETDFFVNYDPYTSSVFPFNQRFADRYLPFSGRDYRLGEAARPMEKRRIATRSLDSLVASREVPAPDFLSLDTQGSEFEILVGAADCIRRHLVGVMVEVAFADVYVGQRTFPDVHSLMLDAGFELAALDSGDYAPFRGPIGARAVREPLFGDALYFRSIDRAPEVDRALALYKLAALAAWLGHVEYALATLRRADAESDRALERSLATFRYFRFLRALQAAAANLNTYPPSFAENLSFEESRARFTGSALTRQVPSTLGQEEAPKASMPSSPGSELVAVFEEHGLDEVAGLLKPA